tara:strand:- start:2431 stop:3015 length:585 start_codon:yes stop_codon:yes gene_type:complete
MALFTPNKGYKALDWQSNTRSRVTTAVSGKVQRIKTGAQHWSFKLQSPSMTRAEFMADYSFLVQLDGQVTSFTIIPPEIGSARGTASGTLTNDATVAAGQSACQTDGGSGTLLKGDLIKFSNHDKVYMVTADKTISGTNDAINFYPPLVTGITSSTTVTYDNVPVKVYMDKDEVKFITQTDGAFKYEIVLNEEI